ncbi:MAG: oxetanocin [Sandaracinus sp.]|nr:oxetanocin [Sandaracinus sp.]
MVLRLDPLADLPRTGWLLRGVAAPESIAAHSHGVALVAMLLVDALRERGERVDGERVLRMALVHDAPEAATGDVPMPVKSPALDAALKDAEATLAARLLGEGYAALWREAEAQESLEARVVKAADKIQMMIKLLAYEAQGRGALREFWENPKNERDAGLPFAREVFEEIRRRRVG